jgi:hypothetical protein
MRRSFGLERFILVVVGLTFIAAAGLSDTVDPDKLPEPVAKTFKAMFPAGTIEKLTSAEENGMTVYDFEFRSGAREMETDIVNDGTMIESTLVIAARDIPGPAMKVIQKAARGATLGRLEWIHTLYEIEDGKVVKLATSVIKYAADMTRGGKAAEIIVDPKGGVLEAPVWVAAVPAKPVEAPTAPKTGK